MRVSAKWSFVVFCLFASFGSIAQCNAGSNATIQICEDDGPLDLFGVLGGFPFASGSWIDATTAPFSGTFDPSADAAGAYTYIVSVNPDGSSCGTADSATVNVGVSVIPNVSFSMNNTTGCGSVSVNFTDDTPPSGLNDHQWDFGDGTGSFNDTPFHTYQDTTGCFDVSLTLSNSSGCTATDTLYNAVCILLRPTAMFSLVVEPVSISSPTALFVNESTDAVQYDWNVPGIGNFNAENPQVQLPPYEDEYTVCLDALSADGCIDTFCKQVRVRQANEIFVPSAFTVDGNDLNNNFRPVLTFVPNLYLFTIFDRWGDIVFESRNYNLGWNGAHKDSEFIVPDGDYSWKIRATKDGKVIERFGQVALLR